MSRTHNNQRIRGFFRASALALSIAVLAGGCGMQTVSEEERFNHFTDELFKSEVVASTLNLHLTLTDPAAFGITDYPVTLGEYSLQVMQDDSAQTEKLLQEVNEFSADQLSADQRLTQQILQTYLETSLESQGLELYARAVSPTVGIQAMLPMMLAEYYFTTQRDVEDYLTLLGQVEGYYKQILSFEQEKSAAGLFMSDATADAVIASCDGYLLPEGYDFLLETFQERLDALPDIKPEEKEQYIVRNREIVEGSFVEAYRTLSQGLSALKGTGPNDKGLCYFPQGTQYYEYLIRADITDAYDNVDALWNAVVAQLADDLDVMRAAYSDSSEERGAFTLRDPRAILESLRQQIERDFPPLPACSYVLKYVPKALESSLSPAFYLVPPIDRAQENVIYINGAKDYAQSGFYSTLAHEGFPGHLYQAVYFSSVNTCALRDLLSFGSYSEGWGTYAENYAFALDNGLGEKEKILQERNSSMSGALYALVDMGIHYYGWDQEETARFLSDFYDLEGTDVAAAIFDAVVGNPSNYLKYNVGYLEIRNLRDRAAQELQESFSLLEFHRFILDIGPAPFSIIRARFDDWLRVQKKAAPPPYAASSSEAAHAA